MAQLKNKYFGELKGKLADMEIMANQNKKIPLEALAFNQNFQGMSKKSKIVILSLPSCCRQVEN